METLVWGAHVILASALIILVLVQHGKGADMGAAFGSGSAGSLFGPSGSATFLSRMTSYVAAMFFVTSMSLTYLSANKVTDSSSVMSLIDEAEDASEDTTTTDKSVPLNNDLMKSESDVDSKANQIPK